MLLFLFKISIFAVGDRFVVVLNRIVETKYSNYFNSSHSSVTVTGSYGAEVYNFVVDIYLSKNLKSFRMKIIFQYHIK